MVDGEEMTTEFYTEGQAATPPSYGKNEPSRFYYECIEDTVATVGTPELEAEMFEKYRPIASVGTSMLPAGEMDQTCAPDSASTCLGVCLALVAVLLQLTPDRYDARS